MVGAVQGKSLDGGHLDMMFPVYPPREILCPVCTVLRHDVSSKAEFLRMIGEFYEDSECTICLHTNRDPMPWHELFRWKRRGKFAA